MYGIASYMFMFTISNIYIVSTGLKEKPGGGHFLYKGVRGCVGIIGILFNSANI